MVDYVFSYQVWEKIEKFFCVTNACKGSSTEGSAKSMKKTKSMNSYLLDLKKIIDQLAVVGAPITTEEYIKIILDGLPTDYNPLMTSIIFRLDPYSIDEMEALLLGVEARIEKCHSDLSSSNLYALVQAHVAQHNSNWQYRS